ncbi:phosphatidylethanolamine-binding protein [Desarmillaria tabescens]|uniref:Phosphatidylethanolamine-binding protein n=1 Tax=Armillaria tabescens TaxID=1929756 RepID=A0AA39JLY1_ARMTA|nr:phosphatidylethanolamine-binding protein [Desarmillaria tabescens]KAK0444944.1 phosphatidylethanolamine-binding protein [Desarmillaria tabescens]
MCVYLLYCTLLYSCFLFSWVLLLLSLKKIQVCRSRPEKGKRRKNLTSNHDHAGPTSATSASIDVGNGATRRSKRRSRPRTPKWRPALPTSVLPAYDEAIKLIRQDSFRLKRGAAEVRRSIKPGDEDEEEKRKLLRILQVQSEINLPEVRWAVKSRLVDMRNPAHRHLREQNWRGEGKLDLLMERIHQMNVVPDVLPSLHPSIDVSIKVRQTHLAGPTYRSRGIEPGVFLSPKQTIAPPTVYATAFHLDTRLYTMMLVDPDVPDPENETFTTFLHWLCPNVPLSAITSGPIKNLNTHTQYVPPHPQQGTPYHRYTLLLLPQPARPDAPYSLVTEARSITSRSRAGRVTSRYLPIPVVPQSARTGFNVREFCKKWSLDGRQGGGAHMWREVWDESSDVVYKNVLHADAPKYGHPPRPDRYGHFRGEKKYIAA